jgi:hypothetical protein
MSDVPFHLTRMGMRFYESTVPALVRELQRLNENLERLADLHVQAGSQPQPQKETEHDPEGRTEDPQPPNR